ncbi:putative ino80 chromatin remodeling complex protein [Diplodia seriata]|nr:putative ino80 chromatin remodeling complex protein [Diplodia seriata]
MYELIQNAEDNSYEHAISERQKPFLKFSLYPDRMVVYSNEDGFTEDNVMAICINANVSAKSDHQGYIGEKGIGFKSVFKIAKKVHIQSESYSFSFVYSRDPNH